MAVLALPCLLGGISDSGFVVETGAPIIDAAEHHRGTCRASHIDTRRFLDWKGGHLAGKNGPDACLEGFAAELHFNASHIDHKGAGIACFQYRLVFGVNVYRPLKLGRSFLGIAGLVALSLALAPELAERTQYALLPREWHQPLVQGMVLIRPDNPAAKAFSDFMNTAPARAVLKKYGYDEVPGR